MSGFDDRCKHACHAFQKPSQGNRRFPTTNFFLSVTSNPPYINRRNQTGLYCLSGCFLNFIGTSSILRSKPIVIQHGNFEEELLLISCGSSAMPMSALLTVVNVCSVMRKMIFN
ncbi:hypothetical protein SADUNF_Sadunf10G0111000 [Salix dunnii]|uniref:Uncharacterized protein n=1 Tax=Salix dunnii TaxID=1413687 RepID=A0A835JS95_9ROSI|nr:hypothetical protein SADUNF_Sadunf10G0111000 [Salix dunnii]